MGSTKGIERGKGKKGERRGRKGENDRGEKFHISGSD